jgi:hypothetical protein
MKKILLIFICIVLVRSSFAQWSPMASGPGGIVRALCVHEGLLYAGGDFTGLVKQWNNGSWIPVATLTGPTSPKVNALISYKGYLYAGGLFQLSSGNFNVAKLTATGWVPVGEGLGGVSGAEVKAFCIYRDSLFAGGTFTQSGTASVARVGKLDGAVWKQVSEGAPPKCTGGVYAMAVHAGELYVGGEGSAPFVNRRNLLTSSWADMTGGITSGTGVYALTTFKYPNPNTSSLFIGGKFAAPFVTCCTYSAGNWGTAFNTFSGGNDDIRCLLASSAGSTGAIYAGGTFTVNSVSNLAKKTITQQWTNEGTNTFNGKVRAMCFYNNAIIAGGDFTSPGTNVATFATTIGIDEVSSNVIVNNVFPNPVIHDALLKVQTTEQMHQPELRMMDATGNEVSVMSEMIKFDRSTNEIEYKISCEGLATGLYYYVLVDQQQNIASGKLIIE